MLPKMATLNNIYRQLDGRRGAANLYLPNGTPLPRVDEYAEHFFRRCGQSPYHKKPQVYALNCVSQVAFPVQFVSAADALPEATDP